MFSASVQRSAQAGSDRRFLRVTLFPGETLRVPPSCRRLAVWAGSAWVTYRGDDLRLLSGEGMAMNGKKDAAVVSALGDFALVLELGEKQSCRQ